MFEKLEGDLEINPSPMEVCLIRRAESLVQENNLWGEELKKALRTIEESRRISIPAFNFAISVLDATVQDATNK